MELGLRGKTALITGGSRGIGRGIALELAQSGCTVVLSGRDRSALSATASQVEVLGGEAHIAIADLLRDGAPESLADSIKRDFGRLDILVNNAGAVQRGDFFKVSSKEWQDGFRVKFFAHVLLCRELWPLLKAAKGSAVFISGIGARAPVADYMIGASVIGASLAFMKALADIGKRDEVQVLAINPGSVDTDRFRRRLAIIMRTTGLDEAAAIERHRHELDITRFGTPQDVGNLVAFAVSSRGRWLHGTAIDIDGGQVDPLRMSRYDDSTQNEEKPKKRALRQ